jgi:hypothetical protein
MTGAMSVKFEFDQRAIDQAVNAGVEAFTAELQRALDDVHAQHQGQPVEQIKTALRARLAQVPGATPDEQMISEYAEHISTGSRIQLNYQP